MPADTIAAAILAGGAARRFGGQDKTRLVVDGRSIIVRQVDVLQRVASEVLVIGGPADRFSDVPVTVHSDLHPGCGALGGLYTALEVATRPVVVVVAGDMPFLDVAILARLAELASGSDDVDGAWVRTPRGVEPLCAAYRRRVRSVVRGEIEAGRLKASDLGSVLRMAELTDADLGGAAASAQLLTNVNTPEDWRRLQ